MRLPNAEKAVVDIRKLTEYALSPTHPVGRHKAELFRTKLGITRLEAFWFAEEIMKAANSKEAELGRSDEFGQRYVLDFELSTETGSATVRTAWIVKTGEENPTLVTCYLA